FSFGYSPWRCEVMILSDASAWLRVTPGFRRPTTVVVKKRRSLKLDLKNPERTCGYMLTGIQICSALPNVKVPLNPAGATPITVYGVALRVKDVPTTFESEPSLFRQKL